MSYYFDYIIKIEDFDKVICYYTKNNMRVFTFMMFHAELLLVQSHKVDGLEIMLKLNVWHYLVLKNMISFSKGLYVFDSDDDFPLEKTLIMHNVVRHINGNKFFFDRSLLIQKLEDH